MVIALTPKPHWSPKLHLNEVEGYKAGWSDCNKTVNLQHIISNCFLETREYQAYLKFLKGSQWKTCHEHMNLIRILKWWNCLVHSCCTYLCFVAIYLRCSKVVETPGQLQDGPNAHPKSQGATGGPSAPTALRRSPPLLQALTWTDWWAVNMTCVNRVQ